MAIRIIEGVPGSGKTYYAVRHLAKTYFKKNEDGVYLLNKPCVLITNIEGFVPDHVDLDAEIKKAGGVETFFSIDYQRTYKDQYFDKIVYILDEAQMKFRKGARNLQEVYSYFEYHRHWGQDIYLVTQNTRKLPPDIVQLVENIIVAAPRIRSILGEFKYKWMDGNTIMKREAFKPSSAVFALYSSMDEEETEKIKNPIMRTVALALVGSITVLGLGYWFFTSRWSQASPVPSSKNTISTGSGKVVPVRSPGSSAPLVADYSNFVHFVPLSIIEQLNFDGLTNLYFVWQGDFFLKQDFPYPVVKIGRRWYAQLDGIIYSFIFNE